MADDRAAGIRAAGTGARIFTFLIDASKVARALAVADALGSASRRYADEFRVARARW